MKFLAQLRNRLRKNLIKNESGQGATEYILLVAVVVGLVMVFGKDIKKKISETTAKVGSSMDTVVDESVGGN